MSGPVDEVLIGAALEGVLAAIAPPLPTQWENTILSPLPGPDDPYQDVALVLGPPNNDEIGRTYLQEGYLQVILRYPPGKGRGPALTRAHAIRAAFPFKSAIPAQGLVITISGTPQIYRGYPDADGRYAVPVRIPCRTNLKS